MTSDKNEEAAREFGGPLGTAIIMVLSHGLMLYLWIAWRFNDGAAPFPAGLSDVGSFLARTWQQVVTHAAPTWSTFAIYWAFLVAQGTMAALIPGLEIKGLPIPSRGGKQLVYRCNGTTAWYLTLPASRCCTLAAFTRCRPSSNSSVRSWSQPSLPQTRSHSPCISELRAQRKLS